MNQAKKNGKQLGDNSLLPESLIFSSFCTTSSISGRLSGFASQHLFMIFASLVGQRRGIFGRKPYTTTKIVTTDFSYVLLAFARTKLNTNRGIQNLSDDPSRQFTKAVNISIWHLTAVHFPEAYGETVHVAFPVIWFAIQDLNAKNLEKTQTKNYELEFLYFIASSA